ncbi:MAG: glycerol-3-phosphate 1-O-acyltransferase PlsY [Oscillospiraceae bacterium]|nr:glycerol-3-phosphate 1-O-acyltransferase PlsY [Oscillospiraceae bacterium]
MDIIVSILLVFLSLVISYLLGSISFAVLLSKIFAHKDVRNYGSGNAGMTNVVRTAGVLAGVLTLLFDIVKGAVACSIGKFLIFSYLYHITGSEWLLPVYGALLCGIFCQLGHIFPIYFGFKGGKGVATTVGIMAICNWMVLVIALSVFIIIFLLTKTVSKGSIPAAASLPISMFFLYNRVEGMPSTGYIQCALTAVFAIIIIVKHKDNIIRIIHGEEKTITSKK